MTARKYLITMLGVALASWISWWLVITRMSPCTAPGKLTLCHSVSVLGLFLFFFSGCVALTASFTFLGFAIRLWFHQFELYLDHVSVSFRQGVLLALATIAASGLLLLNALTWWSGFLLIAIILLVELYFSRDA